LLGLLGGAPLEAWVTPDDDGRIGNVLIMHLPDWRVGLTGEQQGTADVHLLRGRQLEDGFGIDPSALVGDPPRLGPRHTTATLQDAELRTAPAQLTLDYPLLSYRAPQPLPLEFARYTGSLRVAQGGFDSMNGRLQGYLTNAALAAMLVDFYEACDGPQPPDTCRMLQQIAPTAADALNLLEALIGYDVRWVPNRPPEACEADCNAIGVCLLMEFSAQHVIAP
jgi:hypothetical protein